MLPEFRHTFTNVSIDLVARIRIGIVCHLQESGSRTSSLFDLVQELKVLD